MRAHRHRRFCGGQAARGGGAGAAVHGLERLHSGGGALRTRPALRLHPKLHGHAPVRRQRRRSGRQLRVQDVEGQREQRREPLRLAEPRRRNAKLRLHLGRRRAQLGHLRWAARGEQVGSCLCRRYGRAGLLFKHCGKERLSAAGQLQAHECTPQKEEERRTSPSSAPSTPRFCATSAASASRLAFTASRARTVASLW